MNFIKSDILSEYSKQTRCVAVLGPDTIVSGSDIELNIWKLKSENNIEMKSCVLPSVECIAAINDKMFVSGSSRGRFTIWEGIKPSSCNSYDNETWFNCVAVIDENTLVFGGGIWGTSAIWIWDVKTRDERIMDPVHVKKVTCIAAIDENTIVSGSNDRTLIIWDIKTGENKKMLFGHSDFVRCVAVIDPNTIVSGSDDNLLIIWDVKTGENKKMLFGHSDSVWSIAVIDTNTIVSGSRDNSLKIWDVKLGMEITTLSGHSTFVRCVAVIDPNTIVSGGDDGLKIWKKQQQLVKGCYPSEDGGSGAGGGGGGGGGSLFATE